MRGISGWLDVGFAWTRRQLDGKSRGILLIFVLFLASWICWATSKILTILVWIRSPFWMDVRCFGWSAATKLHMDPRDRIMGRYWEMLDLPWWLSGKECACNAGDTDLIPELGRSPGEGNGNPLQYSCLGNTMNRQAWWAIVYGVVKESDTTEWLNNSINWEILPAALSNCLWGSSQSSAQFCPLSQSSPQSSHGGLGWERYGNKMYKNDSGSLLNSWDVWEKLTLIFLVLVAVTVSESERSALIKMCPFPTAGLFVL